MLDEGQTQIEKLCHKNLQNFFIPVLTCIISQRSWRWCGTEGRRNNLKCQLLSEPCPVLGLKLGRESK